MKIKTDIFGIYFKKNGRHNLSAVTHNISMDKHTAQSRKAFVVNTLYFGIIAAMIILVVKYTAAYLAPFIAGFAIAAAIRPIVRFICSHSKLGPRVCSIVVIFALYAAFGGLIWLLGSKFIDISIGFISRLPQFYQDTVEPAITGVQDFITGITSRFETSINTEELGNGIISFISNISGSAVRFAANIGSRFPFLAAEGFLVILSSVFFSMDYNRITCFIMKQIPEKYRCYINDSYRYLKTNIVGYIKTYITIMVITFLLLSVGFWIIGLRDPIMSAMLISLADALPVIGTDIIMIPWIVATLIGGDYPMTIKLTVLYLVVTIIRRVVEPKLLGKKLGQHPIVTLVSIYAGYRLYGIGGMILAPLLMQVLIDFHKDGKLKLWRV
ncbi:MAG: sporulation integral membrane protein YtvI [Oscillospiraceae bacterium]|nr:sporulation integral membrane protein YtvI [Oscillospiraceae bacterium]